MILHYYGIEKSEQELTKLTACKPSRGTSAESIVIAAKKLGFEAFYQDFSELKDVRKFLDKKVPVIVAWFSTDDGHYSIVTKIDKEKIYLQDPEIKKIRIMDLVTFKRVWFDFPGDFLKTKENIVIRRMIVIEPTEA